MAATGRPPRARLHDRRRPDGVPDAGEDRAPDHAAARPAVRTSASASSSATRSRSRTTRRSSRRSRTTGSPRRSRSRPGRLRRPPAPGMTPSTGSGEVHAPTLVLTGTADEVVDPRNSELLAERIPGARLERFEGAGHLFFWQEPQRSSPCSRSSWDDDTGPLDPRPCTADAGPRGDRLPGARGHLRRTRGSLRRARPRALARRPDRDAHREHARARRALLGLREGGRDSHADLLASLAARDRLPARRRRAVALHRRGRVLGACGRGARPRVDAARGASPSESARALARPSRTIRCS